ncbi:DUF6270 domain-containing protein [Pseudomonas sp. LAM2023]|uniref:DUF6270 domain-containing protein n=1 Tax=Pseudomonas sp. LAM2023 TaxID=2800477 RepID=UPI00190DC76A|nr:DUF6270 domain-containing protein [Pseudomonas sp. LAM2023]
MIKNLIIYGSCVSRDIFNLEAIDDFKLLEYYARCSMASLCSAAYANEDALQRIPSAFRRRMVAYDFSKAILSESNHFDDSDIILIDLIDERFDLIALPSGQIITLSNELIESGLLEDGSVTGYRIIPQGSLERRSLWLQGMQKLFTFLRDRNKLDRVVINKVFWSSTFEKENDTHLPVAPALIEKANAELSWMYEVLAHELAEHQFMNFSPALLTAAEQHKWGVSPFHYCEGYYAEALMQVRNKFEYLHEATIEAPLMPRPYPPPISLGAKLTVAAIKTDEEIFVHCSLVIDGKFQDNGNFAFYLVVDGARRDVRWYNSSADARFPTPKAYNTLEIMAFYKDILGEHISARCSVKQIDDVE